MGSSLMSWAQARAQFRAKFELRAKTCNLRCVLIYNSQRLASCSQLTISTNWYRKVGNWLVHRIQCMKVRLIVAVACMCLCWSTILFVMKRLCHLTTNMPPNIGFIVWKASTKFINSLEGSSVKRKDFLRSQRNNQWFSRWKKECPWHPDVDAKRWQESVTLIEILEVGLFFSEHNHAPTTPSKRRYLRPSREILSWCRELVHALSASNIVGPSQQPQP